MGLLPCLLLEGSAAAIHLLFVVLGRLIKALSVLQKSNLRICILCTFFLYRTALIILQQLPLKLFVPRNVDQLAHLANEFVSFRESFLEQLVPFLRPHQLLAGSASGSNVLLVARDDFFGVDEAHLVIDAVGP